jgi:uncharacterized protein (DUF1778 family)
MATTEAGSEPVPERATERMNFRTKPHIKRAIQKAAALSGLDDSAFVTNVAYQAALETIERHERLALSAADAEAFFAALDNPRPPTEALRSLMERHHSAVSGQ